MKRIFVSYSSSDRALAVLLQREFVRAGLQVWMDDQELRPGDHLLERLADAVHDVDHICAIVSRAYLASNWAKKEQSLALSKEVSEGRALVIPILVGDAELPAVLSDRVYADFRNPGSFRRELEKLVTTLGGCYQV